MKFILAIVCIGAFLPIKESHGSAIGSPFYPLNPEGLNEGDVKELKYLERYYQRPKRTLSPPAGSAGIIVQLKSAAIMGAKKKIVQLLAGSVGASARTSAGAIGGASSGANMLKSALAAEVTKKLGNIAAGAAGASNGGFKAVSGSVSAINQLKRAAFNTIGSIAAGSARNVAESSSGAILHLKNAGLSQLGHVASASAGFASKASSSAANGLLSLKQTATSQLINSFGQIASGSARAITGASSSFQTKVQKVSGDFAVGGAEVANHLKTAIAAGTKQKLGQAASGLAGAITGAVGSASAGVGQITRGAFVESSNLFNQAKQAVLQETQRKFGDFLGASAQLGKNSANGVHQFKSALLKSITSKAGQVAKGSAVASGQASQGAGTAFSGSVSALYKLKSAFLSQLVKKIGTLAQGSISAVAGASRGGGSIVTGSTAPLHQLKSAALTYLTKQIGQLSRGSSSHTQSTVTGSAKALHQIKSKIANGLSSASSNAASSIKEGVTGSSKFIFQVKKAAVEDLQEGVSLFAEASADASSGAAEFVVEKFSEKHKHEGGKDGHKGQHGHKKPNGKGRSRRSAEVFQRNSVGDGHDCLDEVVKDLPKRSESEWPSGSGGSADIIGSLKSAIVKGLKQKLVQVAKGSAGAVAGASAGFSKGSFGGDSKSYHHTYSYGPPHEEPPEDHKSIDVWDLKKSVFNTLLQAVKAIKGGVLAIKGQLIKGSGYVVAGGGKLIAASGDKVTKLGKNIINNAILVPPNKGHYTHEYASGYSSPSGPSISYGAPSSSGHGYESHYEQAHEKPSGGGHAGILILRKMPTATTHDKYHSSPTHLSETAVPSFKTLPASGPTFGTVVGKFFTASTSLSPSAPSPFTDSDFHQHQSNHQVAEESHGFLSPPHPPHYEESVAPPITYQSQLIKDFGGQQYLPAEPLGTSYGSPVKEHDDDYLGQASMVNEENVKLTKGEILDHFEGAAAPIASSQVHVPKDAPDSLKVLRGSRATESHTLGPPLSSEIMHSSSSEENYLRNFEKKNPSKEVFAASPSDLLKNFLPHEDHPSVSFTSSQELSNEISSKGKYMKFLENFPPRKSKPSYYSFRPPGSVSYSSQRYKGADSKSRRPPHSSDLSLVESVSYQITPHGVKRLH